MSEKIRAKTRTHEQKQQRTKSLKIGENSEVAEKRNETNEQ